MCFLYACPVYCAMSRRSVSLLACVTQPSPPPFQQTPRFQTLDGSQSISRSKSDVFQNELLRRTEA